MFQTRSRQADHSLDLVVSVRLAGEREVLQHQPEVTLQLHQWVAGEDAGREGPGAAEAGGAESKVPVI